MIIYCCQDLIFATKISSTAQALGLPARPARDAQALQNRLEQVDDGRLNEPVTGVMIDLEMGEKALALLDQVKRHDPRLPTICFGSHVAHEQLQQARAHGADQVLARSAFSAHLPDLLRNLSSSLTD